MRSHLVRAAWLAASVGAAFCAVLLAGCVTSVWDDNAFRTGRILAEGGNEIEGHGLVIYPVGISYARGLSNGLEIRGGVSVPGNFASAPDMDVGEPMLGTNLVLSKALWMSSPHNLSASLEATGFYVDCPFTWYTNSLYGGRFQAGLNYGLFPVEWLGIFVPLKIGGLISNCGNRQILFTPGLGLSFEIKHAAFRVAANMPVPLYERKWPYPWTIYNVQRYPFLGAQILYRWGGD